MLSIRQDTTTPASELAQRYGVDYHVITRIRKGLTWKHVTDPESLPKS